MSLVVVGSVAFDAIETPFGKTEKIIGGAATYISLAASYFAPKVKLVSVVGGDFPKEEIAMLQKHGVDTEGLQIKQDQKSFFWSGRYHRDMNTRETLATELNVLGDFDPIIPDSYQDCQYLMLGNLAPRVQRTVLERLKTRPKLVVLDTMNFWLDTAREELMRTISMVDVLSINDEEARQLSGEYSLRKAANAIMGMGPQYIIIKKGEHGALLFSQKEAFFCPALPLDEVFDPTGAGDTFAGGFIGYVSSRHDTSFDGMKRGVLYGSALASLCVEKFGPEQLIDLPSKEFFHRISLFVQMIQVELPQELLK